MGTGAEMSRYVRGSVHCQVANPRSAQCTKCDTGAVPTLSRTSCIKCTGQEYALQGDEECRTCTFPAMILGIENWCTSLYLVLFLVSLLVLALLVAALFGRFRLCCFKRRLRAMVEAKKWRELHATTASRLEYGVWHKAALAVLEKQKEEVKDRSFQLGISLRFVFEELEAHAFFWWLFCWILQLPVFCRTVVTSCTSIIFLAKGCQRQA